MVFRNFLDARGATTGCCQGMNSCAGAAPDASPLARGWVFRPSGGSLVWKSGSLLDGECL